MAGLESVSRNKKLLIGGLALVAVIFISLIRDSDGTSHVSSFLFHRNIDHSATAPSARHGLPPFTVQLQMPSNSKLQASSAPSSPMNSDSAPSAVPGSSHSKAEPCACDINSDQYQPSPASLAICHQRRYRPLPKVAFLFIGHPRSLYSPTVHESIRRNVLEAFGAEGTTFFYLKHNEGAKVYAPNQGDKLVDSDKPKERFARALSRLGAGPKSLHISDRLKWVPDMKKEDIFNPQCRAFADHKEDLRFRFLAQLFSLKYAYKLVTDYETKHNMKFDWVMRLRPDMFWPWNVAPFCLFNPSQIHVASPSPGNHMPLEDHFNLVPRQLADPYFSLIDPYINCNGLAFPNDHSHNEPLFIPEHYLQLYCRLSNLRVRKVPHMSLVMAREPKEMMSLHEDQFCRGFYRGSDWLFYDDQHCREMVHVADYDFDIVADQATYGPASRRV